MIALVISAFMIVSASCIHRFPYHLPQFHMDINYTTYMPYLNLSRVKIDAYGTYFHDDLLHRYAAFMVYTGDYEGDYIVKKFVYQSGELFQLDLATGDCLKSEVPKGKHGIPWLPKMEFHGYDNVRRGKTYYPVTTWVHEDQMATLFGTISTKLKYFHSLQWVSPPDSSKCNKIPNEPIYYRKMGKRNTWTRGEPFRLEVQITFPHISHPFVQFQSGIYELSCFIPSFKDTNLKYVFYLPRQCLQNRNY